MENHPTDIIAARVSAKLLLFRKKLILTLMNVECVIEMKAKNRAEVAIIGGTGVYDPEVIEDSGEIEIYTPFGPPSAKVTIGTYKGQRIAFAVSSGS